MKKLVLGGGLLLLLAGCGKPSGEVLEYRVLEDFAYGQELSLPQDNQNLTLEEKARELIRMEMGLTASGVNVKYQSFGLGKENSLTVNTLILEGTEIPKVSAFSNEEVLAINQQGKPSESVGDAKFLEVLESKKARVSSYNEEDYVRYIQEKLEGGE